MTFETFDQSDEGTWPDQKKDKDKYKDKHNDKDKYILRAPEKSDPRDLWLLRYLIRVMKRHDLTKKKTMTETKTKTMTKTNTFREHLQRAIFETFELWDIWSEWWGNMTWPTKRQQRRQTQWQWQKFRVWPLIHCYESDSSRPNWWGLTKFHNFRQISQFWPISQFQPNFTILEYLKYLEYLE